MTRSKINKSGECLQCRRILFTNSLSICKECEQKNIKSDKDILDMTFEKSQRQEDL